MVNKLSPEQMSDLKETFSRFDKDNDGKLTISELHAAIRALRGTDPTEAELRDSIKEVGTDGNDTIKLFEFLTLMGCGTSHDVSEVMKRSSREYDKDGDGHTTKTEQASSSPSAADEPAGVRKEASPSAAVEFISEGPERKRRRIDHEIHGSIEQVSDLKETFSHFDKDNDGKLAIRELHAVIRALRGTDPTEAELRDLIKGVSADGNGTIALPEFLTLMGCKTSHEISEEAMNPGVSTGAYDEDSDGYTTETDSGCHSPGPIFDLEETFAVFDKNHDGKLSISELHAVIRTLRGKDLTEAELRVLFKEVDTDGNGTIELPEFLALMNRRTSHDVTDEETRASFRMYDKDGDGYITKSELRQVMAELGHELTDEDVEDMISGADLDGDGRINYDEFVRMMQQT